MASVSRVYSRLRVARRHDLGTNVARSMRKRGLVPAALQGDRLPNISLTVEFDELMALARKVHFEMKLLELDLDGEAIKALPKYVERTDYHRVQSLFEADVQSITFRRWPRDPERDPVKINMPLIPINEDKCPQVKNGGYVHDMFSAHGLPLLVRSEDFPPFIHLDMSRADEKARAARLRPL